MARAMKKPSRKTKPAKAGALVVVPSRAPAHESSFLEVVSLIQRARQSAFQAVNTELIDLYWRVGEYISRKLETAEWGDGVVDDLARYLARQHPDLKGFTRASLFRMRQFYDIYRLDKKVAPLVRQLSWTHNLLILSRSKRPEEREFYLPLCLRERWSKRELERQLTGALFERTVLSPPKVSPLVTQIPTGTPRQDGILPRSPRPRREETPRTPLHRHPPLRHQGQRSGRVRSEPRSLSNSHRRIPDGAAGQATPPAEAA